MDTVDFLDYTASLLRSPKFRDAMRNTNYGTAVSLAKDRLGVTEYEAMALVYLLNRSGDKSLVIPQLQERLRELEDRLKDHDRASHAVLDLLDIAIGQVPDPVPFRRLRDHLVKG